MRKINTTATMESSNLDHADSIVRMANSPQDQNTQNDTVIDLIKRHKETFLDLLLQRGYKIIPLDKENRTLIHFAFYDSLIKVLLRTPSIFRETDENFIDSSGLSHMHIACAINDLSKVKYFIEEKSVDINLRCKNGYTPLHLAAEYESYDVLSYLLRNGVDTGAVNCRNQTALHLACRGYESTNFYRPLVTEINSDDNDLFDEKRIEAFKLLAEETGLHVNTVDKEGRTALFYIFIDYFLEKQPSGLLNDRLYTGLMKKVWNVKLKKIEILLQKTNLQVNIQDTHGETALHFALSKLKAVRMMSWNSRMCITSDESMIDMVKMILENGADIHARNKNKESLLQLAVSIWSSKIVGLLLDYGADTEVIKFQNNGKSSFLFNEVRPFLETVENILEIIRLFSGTEYEFSTMDIIATMDFFVYKGEFKDRKVRERYDFDKSVLFYGPPTEIKKAYKSIVSSGNDDFCKFSFKRFKTFVDTYEIEAPAFIDNYCEKGRMKKTMFCNKVTLYDVLQMLPSRIHPMLKKTNYHTITRSDDFRFLPSIDGHLAKSLIRNFLVESSYQYFERLMRFNLPDVCYLMIMQYLSNEDLINSSIAILNLDLIFHR